MAGHDSPEGEERHVGCGGDSAVPCESVGIGFVVAFNLDICVACTPAFGDFEQVALTAFVWMYDTPLKESYMNSPSEVIFWP